MSAQPTVVVVGAGPAALAAVHRLRSQSQPGVRIVLAAPGGTADYLPGALAVATGDATCERYRAAVNLKRVEVIPSSVDEIQRGRVRVGAGWLAADAVIAAPGLALDPVGDPARSGTGSDGGRVVAFWDLPTAVRVAPALGRFKRGVVSVVIASPLYRCPPAPYGLAIRLAVRAKQLGLPIDVRLTTPEPRPLHAIGSEVSNLLIASCANAGVDVRFDVHVDTEALERGCVQDQTGEQIGSDMTVVIPPHRASPLLAALAGALPLVTVDSQGRTAEARVYAAGDAVASPYPRAAAPAALSGVIAAEGALTDLGLIEATHPTTPEPDCFVDEGAGRYSRIQISYPGGPPPGGRAAVVIGEPALAESGGFNAALEAWRASCSDTPVV